ncbi:MAG: hypothetical protein AAGG75_15900 [Bacteroidota bacterium]
MKRKLFNFEANIIRRRRVSKSALFFGLIAAALLGYTSITYLEQGYIPLLEKLVGQLGFLSYMSWIYLAVFALLFFLVLPAIYSLFRKKVIVGGQVSFDEQHLKITKGREKYVIPEEQLSHLDFELKALPSGKKKNADQLFGGNWMKIPTKSGTFECELDIDSPQKKEKLLEMIEFLKIEHDVEVKVKEVK